MPFAIVLQPHGVIVHGEHVVRTGEYVAGIAILRTAGRACRDGQQCDPARHQDHTGDGELHHVTTTP